MTNYERIKNMSAEDMAKAMNDNVLDCDFCPAFDVCDRGSTGRSCEGNILDWLNEEADT